MVLVKEIDCCHDPSKRGFVSFAVAIQIVQFGWAVDRKTDQELVLRQEGTPLIIKQDAVGLQVVFNALTGFLVTLLQFDHALEKLDSQQGRLAALPGKYDRVARLRLDVLPDVQFQQGIAHARRLRLVQKILFVQVEAVGAIQIALGTARLDHRMKPIEIAVFQLGEFEPGLGVHFSHRGRVRW